MNILIVMPQTSYDGGHLTEYYDFPLGICYISAVVRQIDGIRVFPLNMNQTKGDRRTVIADAITKHSIDVVLTGGLCTLYPRTREIVETAKQVDPKITTVVGGGIVSGDPEATMRALEFADYGVIGEGEATVDELCRAFQRGGGAHGIRGIIFQHNGDWLRTGVREGIRDLASIPWCDYDSFGFDRYLRQKASVSYESRGKWLSFPCLNMMSSRSCPHKCTFCFHPEGASYRQRDLDDVFAELESLLRKFHPGHISFVDEMIGVKDSVFMEFCARIRSYDIPWTTSFRVNDITEQKVDELKRANCRAILLGLESASPRVLKSMRKGITVAQIENALRITHERGLGTVGNFIFGDPEETVETSMETLDWYLAHPQYNITLGTIQYYPGSDIYWRAVKTGVIPDRVQYLKNGVMNINCSKMTDDEYEDITRAKIPEYKIMRYKLLPAVRDVRLQYHTDHLSLVGVCSNCGAALEYHKLSPLTVYDPLICNSCATLHSAPQIGNNPRVRNNIQTLVERYGKVAFWGIGTQFRSVMDPSLLADPRIRLVDMANRKDFAGKRVESPEILAREKIPVAILPPRLSGYSFLGKDLFAEISSEARTRFGVSRFIDLSDLWFLDLSETES